MGDCGSRGCWCEAGMGCRVREQGCRCGRVGESGGVDCVYADNGVGDASDVVVLISFEFRVNVVGEMFRQKLDDDVIDDAIYDEWKLHGDVGVALGHRRRKEFLLAASKPQKMSRYSALGALPLCRGATAVASMR